MEKDSSQLLGSFGSCEKKREFCPPRTPDGLDKKHNFLSTWNTLDYLRYTTGMNLSKNWGWHAWFWAFSSQKPDFFRFFWIFDFSYGIGDFFFGNFPPKTVRGVRMGCQVDNTSRFQLFTEKKSVQNCIFSQKCRKGGNLAPPPLPLKLIFSRFSPPKC